MRSLKLLPAALALFAGAPAWAAAPVTLDQVMGAIRTVQHVDARYVEHRYLHILKTPIETRGDLRFDAPDQLVKTTDPSAGGSGERIVIDHDRMTVDRGGGTPIVIGVNDHPEIAALATSLRATLAGDGAALQREFDVTVSGTLDHWGMVLQPRNPAARKVLQLVRVSGYGERITGIESVNGDGDRSEMNIVEQAR